VKDANLFPDAEIPTRELAVVQPTALSLIDKLISAGPLNADSVGVMERLVALDREVRKDNAERDFAVSLAALQKETGKVMATKGVPNNDGTIRYYFAPFEDIMDQVQPLLNAHSFSVSFDMDFSDGRVTETCILTHASGHQRRNKFIVRIGSGPPKATETQADGAAATYAKRGALCNALNIVTGVDTDGVVTDARSENAPITEDQALWIKDAIKQTKSNEAAFLKWAGAPSYETIGSSRLPEITRSLNKKLASL
jgi:hypothetical protein